MFKTYTQVLWLELRHIKTQFIRVMYITGNDYADDKSFLDRTYQVYVLALIVICFIISWLGFLDIVVTDIFIPAGAIAGEMALLVLLVVPGLLLLFFCFGNMRSCPIKLSHADISFIAASSAPLVAKVHAELFGQVLLSGIAGFLLGNLLGTGIHAVLPDTLLPQEFAVFMALLLILVCVLSWLPGLVRLLLKTPYDRIFFIVFGSVLCWLALFSSIQILSNTLFINSLFIFSASESFIPSFTQVSALISIIIALFALVTFVVMRLSATVVIERNALYAELYPIRHLQFQDPNSFARIRRRKKLSLRGAWLGLPGGAMPCSLITRALLAHIRQFEGIPSIVIYGLLIAPVGALLLTNAFNPMFYLIWVLAGLSVSKGQRELTLVFRDDQRNRMFRDHLPFSTLHLLLSDSMLAFLLASIASVVVVIAVSTGWELLINTILVLLINSAVVICTGLDNVNLFSSGRRFSYELSLLSFLLILLLFYLIAPGVGLLGAALTLVLYVAMLTRGKE